MHRKIIPNWLVLDRNEASALYEQIGEQIWDAILDGRLEPGVALPASRALAQDLGVSRITTLQAYDQLVAEGFLEARRGSGTWVSELLSVEKRAHLKQARRPVAAPTNNFQKHLSRFLGGEPTNLAFQPGIPAFDAFPHRLWSRTLARQAARRELDLLDYAHVGGYAPLRAEIGRYLLSSRGVSASPEQIIVVSSVRAAISAVCDVLMTRGDTVAVEDPGYKVARSILTKSGMQLAPVPVDAGGLRVADLIAGKVRPAGAYLTPTHHWPTGVTLTAERRLTLLDWAIETGAWIIEDDYDSEFRFDSPPLATVYALNSGRVIFVGTFSKILAPSVRVAYLVVPRAHSEAFERHVFETATEPALHVQAALADILAEGHLPRHIGRMRKLYAARRTLLLEAITESLDGRVGLTVPPGGLQIIARLPEHVPSEVFSQRAANADIVARDLAANYIRQPHPNALHLGFAAVPDATIGPEAQRLAEAVRSLF